jgi:hypothetical protein
MWLVGAILMCVIAGGAAWYWKKNTSGDPANDDPKVKGAKAGAIIAAVTGIILFGGFFWARRAAAKAAEAAATGMPTVDEDAPEAVQGLQKLQIANLQAASAVRAKGDAQAAALEAQAMRARELQVKAQNLQKAGLL